MIRSLHLTQGFAAVPYLLDTQLWQTCGARENGVQFALDKPNVIVGPNGSGKTALMTLLTLKTLSYFTGFSALDDGYVRSRSADSWWSEQTWRTEAEYLPGAHFDTDLAPALYYRPGHIAGNEKCVTTAMMLGYFKEAQDYGRVVERKSSGQGCQALLTRKIDGLRNPLVALNYARANWSGGETCKKLSSRTHSSQYDYRAEVLKAQYLAGRPADGVPLILMDEPEQSLDARAELELWQAIAASDCSTRQIIVATHSLYPFMHPEKFNIIEAVPGYLQSVRELMQ